MTSTPATMPRREDIDLPTASPGTRRSLTVLRFGTPGARPKAYVQAGLHADELPGMAVARRLAIALEEAEARGEIAGEIIVVPVANPIGLAQRHFGFLHGRYETGSGSNFNRGYPDLTPGVARAVSGRLGRDGAANVALIREEMAEALARMNPVGELDMLRHRLVSLAHDADFVLDLHADNQAEVHLYTGNALWPGAADLAAELGAKAVLLCDESGGNPFDEACSAPWWVLAAEYPEAVVPPACLAVTVELRSNNQVEAELIEQDTKALLGFLRRRGVLTGKAGPLPPLMCEATPLNGLEQVIAPASGIVVYRAALGAQVEEGEEIALVLDPLGGEMEVRANTSGCLFARHEQPFAWPGRVIGKIAGARALDWRKGKLLGD